MAGAGAEWMLAPHWLVRGEYLFYHLDGTSQLATIRIISVVPDSVTWGGTNTNVDNVAVTDFNWS